SDSETEDVRARAARRHRLVLLPERLVDVALRPRHAREPVAPVRARAAVVRGVRGPGRVRRLGVPLAHAVAHQQLGEDLGARAAVVDDVPAELLVIEEAAPDAPVHLHDADIALRGDEIRHLAVVLDELAPAALLPGDRLHEVAVERGDAGLDTAAFTLRH